VRENPIRLLIGNFEEAMNDLLETVVAQGLDRVAYATRSTRWHEFVDHGCADDFDLILFIPNNLILDGTSGNGNPWGNGVRAVRRIRGNRETPIIVIVLTDQLAEYEQSLLAAGANAVLPLPFPVAALKEVAARCLGTA
jgi:CheY-like chemotaxis protein